MNYGAWSVAVQVSGKPIKFTGEGESMTALEPFYPERMASRILGMGDVLTLVEKAEENVSTQCPSTRSVLEAVRRLAYVLDCRLFCAKGSCDLSQGAGC